MLRYLSAVKNTLLSACIISLIIISSATTARAQVITHPLSSPAINYVTGTTSPSVSVSISATALPGPLVVSSFNANIEFSINNVNFSSTLSIGTGGNVPPTTIYLRVKGSLPANVAYLIVLLQGDAYAGYTNFTVPIVNMQTAVTATAGPITGNIKSNAGIPSASPNIGQFNVTGKNLTSNITLTAPAGFEISTSAGGGYGNTVSLTPTGGNVNSVVYVRSSASAAAGAIYGYITMSITGLADQNIGVDGIIDPSQTVMNGAITTAINLAASGCGNYTWVNDQPGIGLAATGTGNIPTFTAINTGNTPIVAHIKAIPAPLEGYGYFPNFFDSNVSVVNLTDYSTVATIPMNTAPRDGVSSYDGTRVYVADGFYNNISVINTATNKVTAVLNTNANSSLSNNIRYIVINHDGTRLYASMGMDKSIQVFNTVTNTYINTVNLGSDPSGLALSPDGSRLYITMPTDQQVWVLNTATNTIITKINIGDAYYPGVTSPDGSKLFVAGPNTVYVINTSSFAVSTISITGINQQAAVSPNGRTVYVSNASANTVSVINTATNTVTGTIAIGDTPGAISFNGDGSKVYVTKLYGGATIIKTADNSIIGNIAGVGRYGSYSGNFVSAEHCPDIDFTITVNPAPGAITAVNTTYGTASAPATFNAVTTSMPSGGLVTPPAGFEVSTDNITFAPYVTIPGNSAGTQIYIRLTALTAVGSYSGNVVVSNYTLSGNGIPVAGSTKINIAMPNSVVSPAPLAITATTKGKVYGTTLTGAAGSTAFTVTGLKNAETITSVSIGYGTGSAANAAVGTYTGTVTPSAAVGANGFLNSNYTITYANGNITVSSLALTVKANTQSKTYGNADPALTYTITSGVLTPGDNFIGALSRNPGENVGTYAISQSTLALNSNYVLTFIGDNLTIGKRAITVTADAKSKIYGDTDPAFTYTLSGGTLVTGDTFTGTFNRTAGENVGSYTINQGSFTLGNNYAVTYISKSLTVTPKALTITANDQTRAYGGANPTLTLSYNGLVNNDSPASLTNPGIAATVANALSAVGTYPITAGGASSANYTISYVPGTLTVTSAALIITANDKNKNQGEANPTLTYTYNGFVNNEGPSQLTTIPVISTTAVTASPVGTYPITVSGASAANYAVNYVAGLLTVNAPLIVKINIPNTFTPNGDGTNDSWVIKDLQNEPNCTVNIFNRNGEKLFSSVGYSHAWDGRNNGRNVPAGVYYYVIDLRNKSKMVTGWVLVIR